MSTVEPSRRVIKSEGILASANYEGPTAICPKPRVLVVDDEEPICLLLNQKLLSVGFECRFCTRSEEASQVLSQEPFDAVISDLDMPGVSGIELLRTAQRFIPHAAFLMMTGMTDVETGIAAMKVGASDHLLKPLNLDLVLVRLHRALAVKKLETEVESHRTNLEQKVEPLTSQLQPAGRLNRSNVDETLDALATAVDLRDNETVGHSRRVTLYALEIANAMGCSKELSIELARGALLHDVGKIGIPDSILLKPSKLTPEETAIMQSHAQSGFALLSGIGFLAQASKIVLSHHERFDGTGYPMGLAGEEIPLGARIFSVADTLDAITSDRPYRGARAFRTASEIIQEESGKQFDPGVVKAFLSIGQEVWENLWQERARLRTDLRRAPLPTPQMPEELTADPPNIRIHDEGEEWKPFETASDVGRPTKVLIAEDDAVTCRLLESCLTRWGYDIVVTHDGKSALDALVGPSAPKLAVLDWEMPQMDGTEVVHALRSRSTNEPYIYLILLTSRGRKEDIFAGFAAGADDYLTKPFNAQELQARMRTGLRIVELQDRLIRAREELREQATHDPLTGAWNRLGIMEILLREVARAARRGAWVSAMMIDIDHFKRVNDTYGHLTGDLVLSEIAGRIGLTIRGYDAFGRYGGEEFLIVLPDCDLPTALERAETLRQIVEARPVQTPDSRISVTISIGVAARRGDPRAEHNSLIAAADQALYEAKACGRNRVAHLMAQLS